MANPNFEIFSTQLASPLRFKLFMMKSLPAAWFAGLRIEKLTATEASISVRYKWFNKNPFNSIYVGVLSMPSEVSTGILGMGALYKRTPAVSMLVVNSRANYIKKAVGKIVFTCGDGDEINAAVDEAIRTGEGVTVECYSAGVDEAGDVVAEFWFTWSFKVRKSRK